jgi:Zn-dependent M16 (insulinase) family peptidase
LAKLPQLKVSDLPASPQRLPTDKESVADVPLLINNVFSNGINYIHIFFDARDLPDDLWMFVPRYSEAISQMGAAGNSFEVMTHRVASSTGGISCGAEFTTRADDSGTPRWGIRFTLRALDDQIEPALAILRDYLFSLDPRDPNRLRDVLIQSRARARGYTLSRPESLAALHSARGLSPEAHHINQVRGLPQVEMTEELAANFDTECSALIERIERLRDFLLCPQRMAISFTGSTKAADCLRKTIPEWAQRMPNSRSAPLRAASSPAHHPFCEGLAVPIPVAHCVLAMPAPHVTSPDFALLRLAAELVESEFLRPEVRFKGNAYGATCTYQALSRQMLFGSYRDPHIARTIHVFEGIRNYVASATWTQIDVNRAIIATAKSEFTPIRPGDATGRALSWHLSGYSPEIQQAHYDALKGAQVETVRDAMLRALDNGLTQSTLCVASNRNALNESNATWRGSPLTITDIRR